MPEASGTNTAEDQSRKDGEKSAGPNSNALALFSSKGERGEYPLALFSVGHPQERVSPLMVFTFVSNCASI